MILVFEKLEQNISASDKWRIGIAGDMFRLTGAFWPVTVRLIKDNRILGSMEHMLAGDYVRGVPFDAVEIVNGATAQDITVQITGGGVGSDRVLGEVSVINGERARTLSGVSFFGADGFTASGGLQGHVQLWNPVGSGKNLIVSQMIVSTDTAQVININSYNVALANVTGNPASKMLGGAVSVAELRYVGNAGGLGTSPLVSNRVAANFPVKYEFAEPVIVPPGRGLQAIAGTVATLIYANFEFYEETI